MGTFVAKQFVGFALCYRRKKESNHFDDQTHRHTHKQMGGHSAFDALKWLLYEQTAAAVNITTASLSGAMAGRWGAEVMAVVVVENGRVSGQGHIAAQNS